MPKFYTKAPVIGPTDDLVQLDRIVVNSTAQTTLEFKNINQDFLDLQLKYVCRSVAAVVEDGCSLVFNNDTTAGHYDIGEVGYLRGSGAGAWIANGSSYLWMSYLNGASAPAGYAGYCTINIPNYSSTAHYKHFFAEGTMYFSAGTSQTNLAWSSGYWLSTAAINRITIGTAGYMPGSSITLYGVGRKSNQVGKL